MPNEMNHADLADRLDKLYEQHPFNFLHQAAADERRIANGKLVEVVHGEWKPSVNGKQVRRCSICNEEFFIANSSEPKYCPSCGALMNGKDDNDVK